MSRMNQLAILGAWALGIGMGFMLGTQDNQQTLQENNSFMRGTSSQQNRRLDFADPKSVTYRAPQFLDAPTETSSYNQPPPPLEVTQYVNVQDVHVKSMCRCGNKLMPIPGRPSQMGLNTGIVQPPSKATGIQQSKHYVLHPSDEGEGCKCQNRTPFAGKTADQFLSSLKRRCPNPKYPGKYDWEELPDFGVEELPLFVGVLSYKAPLSLNGTLHDWLSHDFFRRTNAKDVFVQLNKRSEQDDEVLNEFQETLFRNQQPPLTPMGSPDENLNPGLAISKFCRAAEAHPSSHPNGENLVMFLEKDWNLYDGEKVTHLEDIMNSINAMSQRGVPYIRLSPPVRGVDYSNTKMWPCPSEGVPWVCTTAHQHRWTNTPLVVSCNWFLRYMEPFALLDDPIMSGCRPGFQEEGYCDWEEAMQDGRVAWTNSQWIVASVLGPRPLLFNHVEVDQ